MAKFRLPRLDRPMQHLGCLAAACAVGVGTVAVSADGPPPPIRPGLLAVQAERIEPAPAPLTLEDLERLALAHNPSLARFQAAVSAAEGHWVQVGLLPNPVVGYEGQQLGSGGRAEQHGVVIEQELVRGGKLRLNREVAAQDIFLAWQQLAAQERRILTDVRLGYYEVLLAGRQLSIAQDIERITASGVQAADALLKAQEVGRVDLLQAQLERENARILLNNSHNRYRAAWRALSAVIGLAQLPPHPVTGDVEVGRGEIDWQTGLDHLLSSSPEAAAALAGVQRARWALERARVEPVPNVLVDAVYNVVDNGVDGRDNAMLRVGVPLPIWNGNQGRIAQAQAELIAAERGFEQVQLRLQERLAPVFERYANASQQVERFRTTILPAAGETLELTRAAYQTGEIGFINLLTVQRTFAQTHLAYLQALRDLRLAEAEIDGLLLRDSLQHAPE
jgi:outer membrane protein, heavy metal efflux system